MPKLAALAAMGAELRLASDESDNVAILEALRVAASCDMAGTDHICNYIQCQRIPYVNATHIHTAMREFLL
jgi:hypothetical protein